MTVYQNSVAYCKFSLDMCPRRSATGPVLIIRQGAAKFKMDCVYVLCHLATNAKKY